MDMIIQPDRRPRDWAYIAALDSKELPSLQQMIKQINETHNTDLIEDFNDRCERHIQGEKDPQFIDVSKADDLVTNDGMNHCLSMILGTTAEKWRYMSTGTGTTAPLITNTAMQNPHVGRIDMSINGWREAVGMKLFFGAIMGESYATTVTSCYEIGIFAGTSGGFILNRNVFGGVSGGGLERQLQVGPTIFTFTNCVFILSSVVEFCPVV